MNCSSYVLQSSSLLLSRDEDSLGVPSESNITPATFNRRKVICDRVHDQMIFPPAIMSVVDTPQFQRLRDLHQLGNCRYLFPGASNTRFEHSLGVAYLGMRMLRQLKSNHEEIGPPLDVSEQDLLCVGIAGLCHDLGHGPLSHMFEDVVNEVRERKGTLKSKGRWAHEDASIEMFDYLLKVNDIDVREFNLNPVADVNFIKILILGLKPDTPWPNNVGRSNEKRYLLDIVANKRNGIDVDKLDYFLRDSMSCYGKLPELHVDRILNCARVISFEGQTQICFEEKVALSLGELFALRVRLHKFVYQHRVVKVLDEMTKNALIAAEDHFRITLPSGQLVSICDTVDSMEAYEKTGDWIFNAIQATCGPELAPARDILTRIRSRMLYQLVGCYVFLPGERAKPPSGATPVARSRKKVLQRLITAEEIMEFVPPDTLMPLSNIFVTCTTIVVGSTGDQVGDPLNRVRFFNPKKEPNTARRLSADRNSPLFTPQSFEEHTAFVYSRERTHATVVYQAFQEWFILAKNDGRATEATPFVNASPNMVRKRTREDMLGTPPPLILTPQKSRA